MVRELDEIRHPVVRAVLREMQPVNGLEIHHDGDLPARSGLGSSSSFAVGILHSLAALEGRMMSKLQLARQAIRVEQDVLKETVGCQDQITAAFGGFNRIQFLRNGTFDVEPIVITREKLDVLEGSLMLFFTGLTRSASTIAEVTLRNMKAKECELFEMRQMVDHAIDIIERSGDLVGEFGDLMHKSWMIKRSLANNVTTPKIDEIYEAARAAGATGGKLLGAGGGGFLLLVVPKEKQAAVREKLASLIHVAFRFETGGSKLLVFEVNNRDS